MMRLVNQVKHGQFETGNIKVINGYCPAMSLSPPIMLRINHLLTYKLEILRPRLLSGAVQSVQFLVPPAAVDISPNSLL